MAKIVKIDSRYRITIPEEIRREMGIKAGDLVLIREKGPGVLEVTKLPEMTLEEAIERYRDEASVDPEQLQPQTPE